MKNFFRISIAAALLLALFVGIPGARAALQSYNSGFQVQNLEGDAASVTIIFYERDGDVAATVTDTIPGNSSTTYFPLENLGSDGTDVPENFDGSVVINSNRQIAAITNVLGSDGTDPLAFGASYSGFTSGAPTVSLPLLMNANFGFNTWFSVQNAGTTPANISVTYSDGVTASANNVAPGAAAKFDQTTEGHAPGWVGSATVSGNGVDVVIAALEVGPTTLFAYNGFGAGSIEPVMPLVQANNFGYVSGIQIQNSGSAASEVTVSFTPSTAGTACTETRTIPAGQSVTFGLYSLTSLADPNPGSLVSENCPGGSATFVGSASVTGNTAGVPLNVIVNQLNSAANKGAAYGGFDPGQGTPVVVLPLIMDRNFGYFTGFSLVNVGSSTIAAADLSCEVSGADGNGTPVNVTINAPGALDPGEAWTEVNLNNLANGFVGSATCSGPAGSSLVGVVNELNNAGGDAFLVYEGTNIAP